MRQNNAGNAGNAGDVHDGKADPVFAASAAGSDLAPRKRRPPPGRKWRKGESGNPRGGSKVLEEVRSLARQFGPEALECIVKLMRSSKSPRVRLAAAQEILNRGFGRPPLEVSGPGGSPLAIGLVTGVPITNAIEAAAAYQALLGGRVDPNSIVFASQRPQEQPAALKAPETLAAVPIAAPALPASAAVPLGDDSALPPIVDDGTSIKTWLELGK